MSDSNGKKQQLHQTLRELKFLEGVPDEYVAHLASLSEEVEFPAGSIIFNNLDLAVSCYLIIEGSVALEICGPGVGCTPLLTLGDGDLLGIAPLLGQTRLTATARTLSATRAIEIPGAEVVSLCEQNPRFGYYFMRSTVLALAKRLTATQLQLLDMYRSDARV